MVSAALADVLLSLAGSPALPGARCRGRHTLFDERGPDEPAEVAAQRHSQALTLCQRCPALDRCTAWIEELPPRQRPPGVVAAQLRAHKPVGRPKRPACLADAVTP